MSIAQEVCRIVEERAGMDGCESVLRIGVEVGDESGVEPDNLLFWLEALLEDPPFHGAVPVIHQRKGDVLRVSYLEVKDGSSED